MTLTYEKIETENYVSIKATNENGVIFWIPADPANSDYQAYLNPVEHLTEIPTKEAYLATLASESAKELTESVVPPTA